MKSVNVVVLVLENDQQQILVAQRPLDKHQGGLWEFPGGKVEKDEEQLQALKREIKEELNYDLKQAQPLKNLTFEYTELTVILDVWYGLDPNAKVFSNENQPLRWVTKSQLKNLQMPAANGPIVDAIMSIS